LRVFSDRFGLNSYWQTARLCKLFIIWGQG